MSYIKTNIGDTGQILIDNLDNNFGEVYTKLSGKEINNSGIFAETFRTGYGLNGTPQNPQSDTESRIYTNGERISFFTKGRGDPASNDEYADGVPTQSLGANLTVAHDFTGWFVGGFVNFDGGTLECNKSATIRANDGGTISVTNGGYLDIANNSSLRIKGGYHELSGGSFNVREGWHNFAGGRFLINYGADVEFVEGTRFAARGISNTEFVESSFFRTSGSSKTEFTGNSETYHHDSSKHILTESAIIELRGKNWANTSPYPLQQPITDSPFIQLIGGVVIKGDSTGLYINGRKVVTE